MRPRYSFILLFLACMLLAACHQDDDRQAGPRYGNAPKSRKIATYRLAIHPLHNPEHLIKAYMPMIDYLNANIADARFVLEASRDYSSYEAKYRAGEPEFLLPNPWQTLQAIRVGYHVLLMAGDARDFKGIFLVRKGSPIHRPVDVKGKRISYPSPTALAACIMPQLYLQRHGVNVMTEVDNRYVGSQESSINNVLLGLTDVDVTWPPPWRAFGKSHPAEADKLKVIWETPTALNNSVMARDDMPLALQQKLRDLLLALGNTQQGRGILAQMETSRFYTANNASYEPVRQLVRQFEAEVRPVEQPR